MTSAQNLRPLSSGNKRSNHCLRLAFLLLLLIPVLAACGGEKDNGSDDEEQSSTSTAQDTTPRARVSVSRAAVYLNPDREAITLMTLVEGDELEIIAKTPPDPLGSVFYSVRIGEQSGWILSSQVETSGDIDSLRVFEFPSIDSASIPTAGAPTEILNGVLLNVTVPDTPLYDDPRADSPILTNLVQDVELTALFRTPPDEDGIVYYGVEVPLDNTLRLGWISSTNVEITGDPTTLQLVYTSTPAPVTGVPTVAVAQDVSPTDLPIPTNTLPPANTSTQAVESANISPTQTRVPTLIPSPLPTATPEALVHEVDPPIQIDVPPDWESGHFEIPTNSSIPGGDTEITVSVYEGTLPNGVSGNIWVFSGFSNLVPLGQRFDLYPDANLILRSLLFSDCNIGVDTEERTVYQIGPHQAIGGRYVAVGCQDEEPDIGGWFAALPVNGKNYVFFVGVEPPNREVESVAFFQDLLDTVQFLD